MGFANSFADGFAGGFKAAYTNSSEDYTDKVAAKAKADVKTEKDKITASLGRFNKRRDTWRDAEIKDLEHRRTAMNTVTSYGGKVPEDSWRTIYTELWSGRTIENIRDDIDKKGFIEIKTADTTNTGSLNDQTNALITPANTAVDGGTSSVTVSESLWDRQLTQESGKQQNDSKGNTLESPKGALGISQSLVSTAADPGFKAKSIFDLADEAGISYTTKDENSARALLGNKDLNEAFGKGYMNAMLSRYEGNEEKALIAYNFGPDNADKYNGDRSTLPKESQEYLTKILGSSDNTGANGSGVNNKANTNQDNWAIFAEDKTNVMTSLGISEDMFEKTMNGFMPELPALKYAWGVSPEEEKDKPDWQVTSKIRKDNYIAFAAAAGEAGDNTRKIFILAVGSRLVDPTKPPKYLDPLNFTASNAEGYLLAAESALENATTDAAKTEAQTGITRVTAYLERISDKEPWYLKSDISKTNVSSRIQKATAKGDMKALAHFNVWVKENTKLVPDNVTNAYVASKYAEMALKALQGGEDEKTAFNEFKNTHLPILITALRLNSKEGDKPSTLVAAYDALAKAKELPENTDGIKAAEERIRELLNIDAAEELNKKGGKQIQLIKREKNKAGSYTGIFKQTTGYVKADPLNPGKFIYTNRDGVPFGVEYEELSLDVDKQARQVVSSMSVDIKNYHGNRKQALGAVRLFGDIVSLVEQDDRILTATAGFTIKVDSLFRNASVGLGLLDNLFKKKNDPNAQLTLNEVQMELRDQGILKQGQTLQELADTDVSAFELSANAKGLAQRKAIFEAKMILFTFRAGGLEGQSGQAMSNKDFDRLRSMLTAGGGKEAFLKATQGYVNDRVSAVSDEWKALSEDVDMRAFFNRHNYNPLNNEPAAKNITTLMSDSTDDPRMKRGVGSLTKEYTLVNTPPKEVNGNKTPDLSMSALTDSYLSGAEIIITPEFYERFKKQLDALGAGVGQKIKKGVSN
jgi:hypothetical protein